MFIDFAPGFSCSLGAAVKVFVRRNGSGGPLREVRLPPNSKLSGLLEKASKALDLDCPSKAFYSNGVECTDIEQIDEDEVLHISCGEPFKVGSAPKGTQKGAEMIGNFVVKELLGQGGFGSVRKGVHMETGETAAVKFVPKGSFRHISDLERVFQEIQSLRQLRHPNVIRIIDVVDHPDSVVFIMEFAAGGELRGYIEGRRFLSEDESRVFFKQIVRAVHYIHSKKIIHRDLKLENILLDAQQCCKIVDFGLSDYVSSEERTVTDAGTEAYLAPEVWNGSSDKSDPYKLDVWSMGVILFAMAHGRLPFSRPDRDTCAKLESSGLDFREELTGLFRKIARAMLTPAPEKRAQVCDVTLDPWVTGNRFAHYHMLDGEDGAGHPGEGRGIRRLRSLTRRTTFFERAALALGPPGQGAVVVSSSPRAEAATTASSPSSRRAPAHRSGSGSGQPAANLRNHLQPTPREPKLSRRWSASPRPDPRAPDPDHPGRDTPGSRRQMQERERYRSSPGTLPPVPVRQGSGETPGSPLVPLPSRGSPPSERAAGDRAGGELTPPARAMPRRSAPGPSYMQPTGRARPAS